MKKTKTSKKEIQKKILVIYHKNCLDGFTAAWTAWKALGNKAEYMGVTHPAPSLENFEGKDIFLLDFCYNAKEMKELKVKANSVIVIDHHVSQKDAVKISTDYLYDIKHSGAVLASKYFFPKNKVSKLALYVEDKDIWKLKLPYVNEVLAAVGTKELDFKTWDKLALDFESKTKFKQLVEIGSEIVKYNERNINSLVSGAELVKFAGKKVYAVNSSVLVSEVGNILALKTKSFSIVWTVRDGKLKVSMRATGKSDVSKIAVKYGGGGHKGAASFSLPIKKDSVELPWQRLAK